MAEFGSTDINAESGSLISRFELAKNDILAEFALINEDNGYRTASVKVVNAIRRIDHITSQLASGQAEIGVQLGKSMVSGLGQNWTSFESVVDVWVQAVIQTKTSSNDDATILNTAVEALRQDVLKVCGVLITKYINNFKGRWNFLPNPIEVIPSFDLGDKGNVGGVALKFQIQLRSLDGTFK